MGTSAISFQNIPVHIGDWSSFQSVINNGYTSIFILTDTNVSRLCLKKFTALSQLSDYLLVDLDPGEEHKNMESVQLLLDILLMHQADKKCLLINLGGGVITDLGGFCASIYKRGIDFINVPTSLLGMVDAALGGKTGIDHHFVKNVAGSFSLPLSVYTDIEFLETLPHSEFLNGMAEVYKHAIIADADLWEALKHVNPESGPLPLELLVKAIKVKTNIVDLDFKEHNERKLLNFGHTIGHALEALYIKNGKELPHGFAVAAGMWMEAWINNNIADLSLEDFEEISGVIDNCYPKLSFHIKDYDEIINFTMNDKKSVNWQVQITHLLSVGYARPVLNVSEEDLKNSLTAYNNICKSGKSL